MSRSRVSCRATANPDDGYGGAGSLGGCVPGTDDHTNDSATPFVAADPPRQLRRSRSPAYDHLNLRRFEFVPLWGCMVVFLYCRVWLTFGDLAGWVGWVRSIRAPLCGHDTELAHLTVSERAAYLLHAD